MKTRKIIRYLSERTDVPSYYWSIFPDRKLFSPREVVSVVKYFIDKGRAKKLKKVYKKVTRVEVIDEKGRAYTRTGVSVKPSVQDGGVTLKIFVKASKGSKN